MEVFLLIQDSCSVVYFISVEDSTSVLNGFTITGGQGTELPGQPGLVSVRQGGGITIINSGAQQSQNIISNNEVENEKRHLVVELEEVYVWRISGW